ncbi:hypothetical protein FHR83_006160 [Actinoplanes campanulatus]|uniref:Uncharacterized protein n=1 Tax=Actinoplanes campanulatus TaxID=113559 RepID=A0A7W5ALH7_9ACTN|nr:hypothetical protein [Actinoplanes campanulatus]MBB3098461.1 hypothetical protein [Actinoplanes campanulatus]GGN35335.1 hypothetical protein GCM10010109_59300 [Actinoplanes campanulatus]GID39154.1 hypothetical protein Aca09nite_56600 [Actinoplanes campanulatus]
MTAGTLPPGGDLRSGERARVRLAGWALVIAGMGTPATVTVLLFGQGGAATAGAGVIGMMTVAAFAAARAFHRSGPDPASRHRRAGRRSVVLPSGTAVR